MPWNPNEPYNDLPDLPPKVEVETKAILKASIEARDALAHLNEAVQRLPNPDVLIAPISLQEARDSSEIENIVTTDDALFRLVDDQDNRADPSSKEALRYRAALYQGYSGLKSRPVGTNTAIEICRTLKGVDLDIRAVPGTTLRNQSTREVIYTPPNGQDVIRSKLANWEHFVHDDGLDALVRIAIQHYQFEAIHPFNDGNGRTGRILNILLLVEQQLLSYPVLYLSRHILRTKNEYYNLIRGVTERGSWHEWIEYFFDILVTSAAESETKANLVQILMIHTEAHMKLYAPKLISAEFSSVLFAQPYCRISDLTAKGVAKRQTASNYLQILSRAGILKEIKIGRDKLFVHSKFLELLTTDGRQILEYSGNALAPAKLMFPPSESPPTAQTA